MEKVTDSLAKAKSVVFVHFKGLPVKETTAMRRALRSEGVSYTVAKKSLIKRAFTSHNIEGTMPDLEGEIAIAHGEDLLAPARGVNAFVKANKDKLAIVGGVFDGKFMQAGEMMEIATIPPREVLLGQFVNLINSPIQRLAVALGQIAEKKA